MTLDATRRMTNYDVCLLKMADRIFSEFESLPVLSVLQAIAVARADLKTDHRTLPDPTDIEALARMSLTRELVRSRGADSGRQSA
jgi:hypothetical protein